MLLLLNSGPAFAEAEYRFAPQFQTAQILADPTVAGQFADQFIRSIAAYHTPNVGYDAVTGMTLDGMQFDFFSGEPLGPGRFFSAPSKEALHLVNLTLALSGNTRAQRFFSPDNPGGAVTFARNLLATKLSTYEAFDTAYPGFGGYLPWFEIKNGTVVPAGNWMRKLPVLDNGQWAWGMIYAESKLREMGETALADRFRARIDEMRENFERIFVEFIGDPALASPVPPPFLRGVAGLVDSQLPPTHAEQKYEWVPGPGTNDRYPSGGTDESELALLFGIIYATWSSPAIPDDLLTQRRSRAEGRHQALGVTAQGNIAVQQGFWFSAHEVWPVLQFPYLDDPLIRRVFVNGERFRSRYSAENQIPGLMASAHLPEAENTELKYEGAFGIPKSGGSPASRVDGIRTDIVSPYAAFPLILANERAGLAFLHTMLLGPKVQTPFGVAESIAITGAKVATIVTSDGNTTLVTALALNEEYRLHGRHFLTGALEASGKYDGAMALLREDYLLAFPTLAENPPVLAGESIEFGSPTAALPTNAATDYPLNPDPGPGDLFAGTDFREGGDALLTARLFDRITLTLPGNVPGYVFGRFRRVPLAQKPYVVFSAVSPAGGFQLELKDGLDRFITTPSKLYLQLRPNETPRLYAIDTREALLPGAEDAALAVFSDPRFLSNPTRDFALSQMRFASALPAGATLLPWDGAAFSEEGTGPVDILLGAVLEGATVPASGNLLYAGHNFNGSVLTLPAESGYLLWKHRPAKLSTRHYLSFEAKTGGGGLPMELKNTDDKVITEVPKLVLDLPGTAGEFQKFYLDLTPALFEANTVAVLTALSDPTAPAAIRGLTLSESLPEGLQLFFDVRRYAATPGVWKPVTPFHDILPGLNFVRGAGMTYAHDHTLRLLQKGFAFAPIPKSLQGRTVNSDLGAYPWLCVLYSSQNGPVTLDFELKNAADQALIGVQTYFGLPKTRITFPATNGATRLLAFNLGSEILAGRQDYAARILSLSDPEPAGAVTLVALGLAAHRPAAVTVQGTAPILTAGQAFTVPYVARNDGPADAEGVVIEVTLPPGVTFVQAEPPGALQDGKVLIPIGTLAVGAEKTVALTLRAPAQFGGKVAIDSRITTTTNSANATVDSTRFESVVSPATPQAYTGVLPPGGTRQQAGYFTISITRSFAFTARFLYGRTPISFTGSFRHDGTFNGSTGPATLALALTGADKLIGSLTVDGQVLPLEAIRTRAFSPGGAPAPEAGRYTVLLEPPGTGSGVPQGLGFGTLTVSPFGNVKFIGTLGDGTTKITKGAALRADSSFTMFVPLYANAGFAAGAVSFQDLPASDADGTFRWLKPNRFDTTFSFRASRYAPEAGLPILAALGPANGLADATLRGGGLSADVLAGVSIDLRGNVVVPPPNPFALRLHISRGNGLLTGSFLRTAASRAPIRGVAYPKTGRLGGFFRTPGASGSVVILPRETTP